jgi:hypothetical protein
MTVGITASCNSFSAMSVFKEGRVPQPDPTTGAVKFLLDDLTDEMRVRIRHRLPNPGDYTCMYQPKINRLDVYGTSTDGGRLYYIRWFADATVCIYEFNQKGFPGSIDQCEPPPFLFDFYRLYAEK